jgi:hypothetical protein
MSTERQRYSTDNQAQDIQKYADLHGMEIVRTFGAQARLRRGQGRCLGHLPGRWISPGPGRRARLLPLLAPTIPAWYDNWNDPPDLLAFFRFPRHLWRKLRTANIFERCFVEVRRRTPPMVCFVNVESVDRIIYSIFQRFNLEWKSLHPPRIYTRGLTSP